MVATLMRWRPRGPLDRSEVDDDTDYLNLGAIWLRGSQGMELRLEVNEQEQQITGVTAVIGESAVQLQAFAAPRTEGVWIDIRNEIATSIVDSGGTAEVVTGEFGEELLTRMPEAGPDGRTVFMPARFVGIDGPRWFLRAVVSGRAAIEPDAPKPCTMSSARRSSTAAARRCRPASCCRSVCPRCRPMTRARPRPRAGCSPARRPQPLRARPRDHRGALMDGQQRRALGDRHEARRPAPPLRATRQLVARPRGRRAAAERLDDLGVIHIGDVAQRSLVTVCGEVRSVTLRPRVDAPCPRRRALGRQRLAAPHLAGPPPHPRHRARHQDPGHGAGHQAAQGDDDLQPGLRDPRPGASRMSEVEPQAPNPPPSPGAWQPGAEPRAVSHAEGDGVARSEVDLRRYETVEDLCATSSPRPSAGGVGRSSRPCRRSPSRCRGSDAGAAHVAARRSGLCRCPARRPPRAAPGPALHRVCRYRHRDLGLLRAPVGRRRTPSCPACSRTPACSCSLLVTTSSRWPLFGFVVGVGRARGLRRGPHVVASPPGHRHGGGAARVGAHRPQRHPARRHGAALPRRAGRCARRGQGRPRLAGLPASRSPRWARSSCAATRRSTRPRPVEPHPPGAAPPDPSASPRA